MAGQARRLLLHDAMDATQQFNVCIIELGELAR